jgi:hypothetical protein
MTAVAAEMFELSETDIAPDFPASEDKAPLACEYTGCTNAIIKPARGRVPKFCPDHKNNKGTNSRSATSGKSWSEAREVESLLTNYVIGIGTGVKFLNETDGTIIVLSGPAVVHELVELAKSDKNLQKYLTWFATPGKYGPLLLALGGVVIPILANHDMIPKFSIPATE